MIKKKNKTYILLLIAVIIYGLIGYRVKMEFNNESTQTNNIGHNILQVNSEKINFDLNFNYENPFVKNKKKKHKVTTPSNTTRDKFFNKQKRVISGSNIGTINSKPKKNAKRISNLNSNLELKLNAIIFNKTGDKICIIKLNGKESSYKEGDEVLGVRIEKILTDSVKIISGKETIYLKYEKK
jgi:hypothetical protein